MFTNYDQDVQIEKDPMGKNGEMRNVHRSRGGKPDGKKALRRPRS
jgi:hypothetical protein